MLVVSVPRFCVSVISSCLVLDSMGSLTTWIKILWEYVSLVHPTPQFCHLCCRTTSTLVQFCTYYLELRQTYHTHKYAAHL